MKINNIILEIISIVFLSTTLWAQEQKKETISLPQITNVEVMKLFQLEKYSEAEALYLKTEKTNVYWIALFKMKQGKFNEAIELLKKEISKQQSQEQKDKAIELATYVIADVSFEESKKFLQSYEKDIFSNLNLTCSQAQQDMIKGDFDKAEPIVKMLLEKLPELPDSNLSYVENTVYLFISQLYVKNKIKEALSFYDFVAKQYPKIRMDPGMQLLWASIVIHENKGMEALKKVDWVIETFPDYCQKNEDMVLITKAQCFESIGDKKESKKILEQLNALIEKNPKYRGIKPMIDDKLKEYRQDEESRKRMAAVAKEASENPYGIENSEQNWTWFRILLCSSGVVLMIIALKQKFIKRKRKTNL
jgi:tetratricopeptide (TPR) repeat protein